MDNKNIDDIKLVFPTEEYKEQVEEYLQEFFDNGEYELAGDGGLDIIKDFDKWLQKIRNDKVEERLEGRKVVATLFLAVRKSDNKVIGNIQIRHRLNEKLLKSGGHIGDSIRPSERRKGYATTMIKLALEECKKLNIDRVLMVCNKNNEGSRKSIIKNGGILENEVELENGEIDQRYWINLKKKFADSVSKYENVINVEQRIKEIREKDFTGDIYLNHFIKVKKPYVLEKGLCIQDDNYKWLEFYDYKRKVRLTAIYDEKNEIVEWYFDIARKIGKEDHIPYEDDLYLDVVMAKEGVIILLDENELKEDLERMEITKNEYEEAYKTANKLIEKIQGREKELKEFTDKYLKEIILG